MAMPPAFMGVNRLRKDWPNMMTVVRPRARGRRTAPIRLSPPAGNGSMARTTVAGRRLQSASDRASTIELQLLMKARATRTRKTKPKALAA